MIRSFIFKFVFSFVIVGILVIIGMYGAFVYTGLQGGKPNLQATSIWASKALKTDIFENNIINVRVCNSGTADLVAPYTIKLSTKEKPYAEHAVEGLPIMVGECRDFTTSFGALRLENRRFARITFFVDSENKVNEMSEMDNKLVWSYDLIDLLPNIMVSGVEAVGSSFLEKVVEVTVCNYPENAKYSIKDKFSVVFTINNYKYNLIYDKGIISGECVKIRTPKFKEFADLTKSDTLSVHVAVNSDRKILERRYVDNTFSLFARV